MLNIRFVFYFDIYIYVLQTIINMINLFEIHIICIYECNFKLYLRDQIWKFIHFYTNECECVTFYRDFIANVLTSGVTVIFNNVLLQVH